MVVLLGFVLEDDKHSPALVLAGKVKCQCQYTKISIKSHRDQAKLFESSQVVYKLEIYWLVIVSAFK